MPRVSIRPRLCGKSSTQAAPRSIELPRIHLRYSPILKSKCIVLRTVLRQSGGKVKSKIQVFLGAVCLLTALVSLEPLSRRAMADDDQERFDGSWAFQFTGTISLPSPFNSFN